MLTPNIVDVLIEQNGVIKRDGKNFRLYLNDNPKESISVNFLRRLSKYLKRDGNKWVWNK